MDPCHVLLGRPWQFDREAVHEGKRNVYSFEMNGKRHSLHPFRGKQEEVNNQLLMMANKRMVSDWKAEAKVAINLQANDYEIEMTNIVCSDQLKDITDQQEMSNASMALMEEAQYEVINDDGRCMATEIIKDGDVTITSKREEGQRIQVENSWISGIIMLINLLFVVVTGILNCLYADKEEPVDNLFACQRKQDFECSKKSEHMLEEPKDQSQTQYWKTWLKGWFKMRTLLRIISWVSAASLLKSSREEAHGQEHMKSFKLGSLMQEHRLIEMKSSTTSS